MMIVFLFLFSFAIDKKIEDVERVIEDRSKEYAPAREDSIGEAIERPIELKAISALKTRAGGGCNGQKTAWYATRYERSISIGCTRE